MIASSRRSRPLSVAAAGLFALGAFGLAGCAKTIDADKLEEEIASQLSADSATCPDDVEAKEGETFECTAELNGEEVTISVDQTSDEGDVIFQVVGPADGGATEEAPATEEEPATE